MLRPDVLATDLPYGPSGSRASDVWGTFEAAARGDVAALASLLAGDPGLARAEYWYTRPIDLAVREGHLEAVRLLLAAGGDADGVRLGDDLLTIARDRGHEDVARLVEEDRTRRARLAPAAADHEIHVAAEVGDAVRVGELLDADPSLLDASDRAGGTPLHRAVAAGSRGVIELLLARGADVHAAHGAGPGSERGYAAAGFQPIDLALWDGPFWGARGDVDTARLLLAHGATYDVTIAAALGDRNGVRRALDAGPSRIAESRPCGKRPLSSAVQSGHVDVVRLLLDRGADPTWPEGTTAPRGVSLHAAARSGRRDLVELLLAHGADPDGTIDSSGSATYAAATPEIRRLLLDRGGTLNAFDLVFLGEDDEVVRRVAADPRAADGGCGGALAAACRLGERELLVRLLDAGARVPPVLTACRTYLTSDPGMLRLLLASGMDPGLPGWQHETPLHDLCGRDGRGRPRPHRTACATILLDAGAAISARDEAYRSTPLAWAARCGLPDMVELLLARGAAVRLPDDEPWATPLAWATRRGHGGIVELLRAAGATS